MGLAGSRRARRGRAQLGRGPGLALAQVRLAVLACCAEVFPGSLVWSEDMPGGLRILKLAAVVALLAGFGGCAGELSNSSQPSKSSQIEASPGTASSTMAQPTNSFASSP